MELESQENFYSINIHTERKVHRGGGDPLTPEVNEGKGVKTICSGEKKGERREIQVDNQTGNVREEVRWGFEERRGGEGALLISEGKGRNPESFTGMKEAHHHLEKLGRTP